MNLRLSHDETIAAIVPHYSPQGDSVEIHTTAGRRITTMRRLRTVVRTIAKNHAADLQAVKRLADPTSRRPLLAPLPLSSQLVLLPVKVRRPKANGDPCSAYINVCQVQDILPAAAPPHQSQLHFRCGLQLPSLWTKSTLDRKLHQAFRAQCTSPLAAPQIRETPPPYGAHILQEINTHIQALTQAIISYINR